MYVHVCVYLKSNVLIVHASKERLKPFNVPLLCLLCNGLQNTLMTAITTRKTIITIHIFTMNNVCRMKVYLTAFIETQHTSQN